MRSRVIEWLLDAGFDAVSTACTFVVVTVPGWWRRWRQRRADHVSETWRLERRRVGRRVERDEF